MQRIEFTCIILFVLLMVSPNLASAKVYKWVDEKGKAHFTDNPGKIPEQFRTPDKEPQAGKKAKKRVGIGRGYSFEIPGNWKVAKRGSLQNKLIFTNKRDDYEPDCSLHEYKITQPFEKFLAITKAAIKRAYTDYRIVSESAFSAKDIKGVKIKERFIDKLGKNARRQTYFFHVQNKKNVSITCQAAIKTKAALDDVFDEIVASLVSE
ncbi:MAG: DUF4124 domain-containing protein [Nitrospina sp.]|jgi:hypothetical protein|nr:DUF4124 domain-containing protein [Nitrospina sp.]MBT3508479.1 DUF4124 domain-containing protein [Nitrospina sp.]MBT3875255.1 DUF4124 domain-containing protein [Nitrospina sp.]MBT4048660.1 DUF4124 domain-containing protein [Nitrospina sp.]MBT4559088.1 DUF4124 domain-containing protein [Nitrospina sp.]